jgi:hypothetical protein
MDENITKTPEEQGKKAIANKVITPKRRYFFPDMNKSVEIEIGDDDSKNMAKAIAEAEKENKS